jgi:hypothetical protein
LEFISLEFDKGNVCKLFVIVAGKGLGMDKIYWEKGWKRYGKWL